MPPGGGEHRKGADHLVLARLDDAALALGRNKDSVRTMVMSRSTERAQELLEGVRSRWSPLDLGVETVFWSCRRGYALPDSKSLTARPYAWKAAACAEVVTDPERRFGDAGYLVQVLHADDQAGHWPVPSRRRSRSGLDACTGSQSEAADLRSRVDWFHFDEVLAEVRQAAPQDVVALISAGG